MTLCVAAATLLALAGCGTDNDRGANDDLPEYYRVRHIMVDSRTIPCIEGYDSALSCDWTAR